MQKNEERRSVCTMLSADILLRICLADRREKCQLKKLQKE